jgi:hypothetical protein
LTAIRRQGHEPPEERVLDPDRDRHRARQPDPVGEFCDGPGTRQCDDRQRVAAGLGDDPVADPTVQPFGHDGGQQRSGVGVSQAVDRQLRQLRQLGDLVRLAHGDHHSDPLGHQAACEEADRLQGDLIEPLGVVDQDQQRLTLARLGEQVECPEPDQEPIRRWAAGQAERGTQGVTLRCRDIVQAIQERRAQLLQTGVGEFHLGLDTGDLHHPAVRGSPGQVVQQRGLPDAGRTAHHQCAAVTVSGVGEKPVELLAFAASTQQRRRSTVTRHRGHHAPTADRWDITRYL